jgi:hypothetical protein
LPPAKQKAAWKRLFYRHYDLLFSYVSPVDLTESTKKHGLDMPAAPYVIPVTALPFLPVSDILLAERNQPRPLKQRLLRSLLSASV